MEPQGGKTKGLVVATRCTTLDEFVTSFQRYCDESSFFVATLTTRPVGLETPFAILLADRSPVLRGLCTVLEAWTTPDNKYKVPGIRLGIRRLTPETADTFARLRPRAPIPPPIPPRRPTLAAAPLVLQPLPPGLRLPSTDMDTIPPPLGRPTTAAISPLTPDPDLPALDADGRMPGSELVLPANPLMNLTDHSLEGFVDCTLYEESPGFTRAAPEPAPVVEAAAPTRGRATIPPIFEVDAISEAPMSPARLTAQQAPLVAFTPVMPSAVDEPVEPPPIVRASRFRLPRWPRWMLVAAPASLIVIVVIAIVAASAGDARSTTVPAPKLAAEPAKPAPPPVRAASPKPAPEPAEDDSEATQTTESGVPIVGTGPCQLTVNSTPAGSTVVVDGKVAGPSPIHLAGPCARRKVEVVHPRYKHAAQLVSLVEGTPKTVDLTLVRPTHKVTITTVPSGATVSIGGRRAGTSPTIVQLMGFSNLKLQITKPGYKPVTTRFYSKKSEDRLSVRLTR